MSVLNEKIFHGRNCYIFYTALQCVFNLALSSFQYGNTCGLIYFQHTTYISSTGTLNFPSKFWSTPIQSKGKGSKTPVIESQHPKSKQGPHWDPCFTECTNIFKSKLLVLKQLIAQLDNLCYSYCDFDISHPRYKEI